jgi:hypothetical protein
MHHRLDLFDRCPVLLGGQCRRPLPRIPHQPGGDRDTDGADELGATITDIGGADPWATRIDNRRPSSAAAGAPLKAETIATLTEVLALEGVRSTADLQAAALVSAAAEAKG